MCNPMLLGLASFAVGTGSTVMNYMGQRATAKAQQEAAVKEGIQQQNSLTMRQVQESEALAAKKQQYNVEEAVAASEVEANAVAAGVDGRSLGNLVSDVRRRASWNRSYAQSNYDMTIQQLAASKKGAESVAQSRIDAAKGPSPWTLVAGIGTSALSGYNTYNKAMS